MAQYSVKFIGVDEFKAALRRNPEFVISEINKFLVRAMALYNAGILNSPWRMGGSGGGAPVNTGNLRDTHQRSISRYQASIKPTAPYAAYVHGTDGKRQNSRGMQLRPWLDFVKEDKDAEVEKLETRMLESIINNLAS